jgi:L-alanine-DL-glutamate epimerase-like enolase superfamily enzyme
MKIVTIETLRPAIQPNLLFVLVTSDDGLVGLGEAFFGARTVEAYIHETAGPALLEMDSVSPERAAMALRSYLGYQGAGAETRGNAALELALWDLLGKATDRSLAELLGGPIRDTLRIYNTCAGSDYVRTTTQQSSDNWGLNENSGHDAGEWEDLQAFLTRPAELAQSLLSEDITAMKVWPFDRAAERSNGTEITTDELDQGLQVVADIRAAVGTRMDVMIELHGLWQRPAATKILRELAAYDPYWVEDPLRPDAVDALIQLRRDVDVPIATGETAVGRRGFAPLLASGVVDYATVDVQWTGGISEARKVAALADLYAVPVAPHDCTGPATLAACAHLAASQPNGLIQETVRAFLRTWYAELVTGLPEIRSGAMTVSSRPGHGVVLRDGVRESADVERRTSAR